MLASRVVFQGHGVDEKIYGLGEHRTGKVGNGHISELILVITKNIPRTRGPPGPY